MDFENGQYPALMSMNRKAAHQSMVLAEGVLAVMGPMALGQFYASGDNAMSRTLEWFRLNQYLEIEAGFIKKT
uniref:Uncharacterized protein n=1 Tax=Romanomermis culicivorax TaxID=13658 RepID=A0A915HEY7_ROMCU